MPSGRFATSIAPTARRGFTLTEVLCVVVILGIATALVAPFAGNRDDLSAASAARIVMGDLAYAQNHAIATQTKHYVKFTGNAYSIYNAPALATPVNHPVKLTSYTTTFGVADASGLSNVSIGTATFASQSCVGFDEAGAPFGFKSTTLAETPLTSVGKVVVRCGAISLTVDVQPYTGDTSME